MQTDKIIASHPLRPPLWHYPAIALLGMFPACLIMAGLVMVSEILTNWQTSANAKIAMFAVSLIAGWSLLVWFLLWEQQKWYWKLDDQNLVRGFGKFKTFPLSSIHKIVPGLPDQVHFLASLNKISRPELLESLVNERRLALLLKFDDGSVMPFHVHKCVNGSQLMTALVQRCAHLVDSDYRYTDAEIRVLKSADWNTRIPASRFPPSKGTA